MVRVVPHGDGDAALTRTASRLRRASTRRVARVRRMRSTLLFPARSENDAGRASRLPRRVSDRAPAQSRIRSAQATRTRTTPAPGSQPAPADLRPGLPAALAMAAPVRGAVGVALRAVRDGGARLDHPSLRERVVLDELGGRAALLDRVRGGEQLGVAPHALAPALEDLEDRRVVVERARRVDVVDRRVVARGQLPEHVVVQRVEHAVAAVVVGLAAAPLGRSGPAPRAGTACRG